MSSTSKLIVVVFFLIAGAGLIYYLQSPLSMKVVSPKSGLVIDSALVDAVTMPLIFFVKSYASLEGATVATYLNGELLPNVVFSYMGEGYFQASGLSVTDFSKGQNELSFRLTSKKGKLLSAGVAVERRAWNPIEKVMGSAIYSPFYLVGFIVFAGLMVTFRTGNMIPLFITAILSGVIFLSTYPWGWLIILVSVILTGWAAIVYIKKPHAIEKVTYPTGEVCERRVSGNFGNGPAYLPSHPEPRYLPLKRD